MFQSAEADVGVVMRVFPLSQRSASRSEMLRMDIGPPPERRFFISLQFISRQFISLQSDEASG
jgi:hypothetical protein